MQVHGRPRGTPAGPVFDVPLDGMPQGGKLGPDLVGASGQQTDQQQTATILHPYGPDQQQGFRLPIARCAGLPDVHLFPAVIGLLAQPVPEQAHPRMGPAPFHPGQIFFFHPPFTQSRGQLAQDGKTGSHQQDARSVLVQTMDRRGLERGIPCPGRQTAGQTVLVAGAGMRGQARRLAEDPEVPVLLQWTGGRGQGLCPLARLMLLLRGGLTSRGLAPAAHAQSKGRQAHAVARGHKAERFCPATIDADLTRADPAMQQRRRQIQTPLQELQQLLPAFAGIHDDCIGVGRFTHHIGSPPGIPRNPCVFLSRP